MLRLLPNAIGSVVQAIVEGLRESVVAFAHGVEGTSPKDIMDMVLLTQVREKSTLANAVLPISEFLILQVKLLIKLDCIVSCRKHAL